MHERRVARTRAHPVVNVLTIPLFGAISGADGWEALEIFAEQRASFFKTFLSMPKGGPSADTFRRVFEALDPKAFQDAFRRWLDPILENLKGQTIALDGKMFCGALAHAKGRGGALHLLHVWTAEHRLLVAQKAVAGAPGEVQAVLELVAMLDLDGATVTADANSCTAAVTDGDTPPPFGTLAPTTCSPSRATATRSTSSSGAASPRPSATAIRA